MFDVRTLLACFALPLLAAPPATTSAEAPDPPQPRNTVFWISVDGLRPDYLDRADTPFLDYLRANGAYSDEVWPVFPSVTFASHVSKATGARPEQHGITGNSFYDSRTRQTLRYPGFGDLLEAEPIWLTASRQGVRTAVLDWPLAHAQRGPVTSAYFGERYERGLSNEERISRVLDVWENDRDDPPLQLVLGYLVSPDTEGHRFGPNSPEVTEAVEQVDGILKDAFERARQIWEKSNPGPGDQLFLIISSDHGMTQVTTLVHPWNLTGLEEDDDITIITTGSVGHIHLDQIEDEDDRERIVRQTLARLSEFDYVRGFARDDIPPEWGYRHPARTGDILLVLESGYTFSRRPSGIEMPAAEGGGPLGMHGYDPATNPDMLTPLFIYRTPEPVAAEPLEGKIHSLQLHATVARILGIRPSPQAVQESIRWETTPAR